TTNRVRPRNNQERLTLIGGLIRVPSAGTTSRGTAKDADTTPAARARDGRTVNTVRALYRRYRDTAGCPRPVQASARPGISCHSAAWGAHRRRSAHIFLTGLVLYRWAHPVRP